MMQASGRFLVLLAKIVTLGAADRVGAEDKDDDDGRNDLEYDTDPGRGLNSFFDAGEWKVSCLVGERPHLHHVGRHPAQKCHFLSCLDHKVWRGLQEPKLSGESQYKARKNGTTVRDGTAKHKMKKK